MKRLLTIVGPNGVGKSTTAKMIVQKRAYTAFVDAEWCRCVNPFGFNESTKQTVFDNIYCLLHNYLCNNEIDTVIFAYGWHGERKCIYDKVIDKLEKSGISFQETVIVLKCSESENIKRCIADCREEERIKRGMEKTFNFYEELDYPYIDTTNMTPDEVAEHIISLMQQQAPLCKGSCRHCVD